MNPLVKTGLTHAGTAIGGMMAVVAFMANNKVDLYAAWNQLNTVVAAITQLVAMLTPIATAAYGIYRTTAAARVNEIANDPTALQKVVEMPVTPQTVVVAEALKTGGS